MGLADQVIAVSDAVAESMIAKGISPHKVCVVKNGTIGSPRTLPINSYKSQNLCRPAIVTVCGMYKRKGIQDLIAAFDEIASNHSTVNLYLVGDGPDREEFEAQAQASLASDRIHFEGFQSEPQRYLLSTDIFVLASHRDPCPLVISEAREAGCAIVASNVDGIPELLANGEAGILVSPGSYEALAQALISLLKSPETVSELKKNSTKTLDCLTANRVCEETLAVYKNLF
jgi:glycosyltransferase involved in cell wall biosynthesis